jgi:uncharacterized protein
VRMPSDLPPRRPRSSRPPTADRRQRGRIIVLVLLGVIVALFLSARSLSGFFVDYLWFDALDQSEVFTRSLLAKLSLFTVFTFGFALFVFVNLYIADRLAPVAVSLGPEEQFVRRYREVVEGRQRLVRIGVSLFVGVFLGAPTVAVWQDWILFRHAKNFGVEVPKFGGDAGFYVFRLPFLTYLIDWMFAALVFASLLVAAAHFVNGAIRVQVAANEDRLTRAARVHLSLLFALLALVKAGDYWLQRFELTGSTRGVVNGATYTDIEAQLPAINLLVLVSLLVAALFVFSTRRGGWRIPLLSVGLWAVVAVVAGAIYPAVIQRFVVQPNVSTRELPYITQNIEATQIGLDIEEIERVDITLERLTTADVESDTAPLSDVRLLDTVQMKDRFSLDQGQRAFYAINDIDVDRYEIDGRLQQVMIAARELNPRGIPNQTWVSRHLIYTHGCGLVAAPASRITDDGRPVYTRLDVARQQLYVGVGLGTYAVLDTDQAEQSCPGVEPAPYDGEAAVELDSTLRRIAFAVHFGEYNLFGSRLITEESQILFVRDVRDRVSKLAPFLRFDADPYPVAADGRVAWVIDAFTTTSRFPNAQRANTDQLNSESGLNHSFNYVRNSVKAVVDAYTGEVTFYIVDPDDPIVQAWADAFPGLFRPGDEVPAELATHFRYPEDLFRVQTNNYGRYRLENPNQFFNRDLSWNVAQAPGLVPGQTLTPSVGPTVTTPAEAQAAANTGDVQGSGVDRFEPYYTMFHAPGADAAGIDPVFSLLRPFVPFSGTQDSRRELVAFMTVSSDPATYGRMIVYQVQDPLPPGPSTVAAEADSDPVIAQQITLLGNTGSRVVWGPLQLVPVAKGLVYTRPLYVKDESTDQTFVRRVIAWHDNRSVIGDSLSEAMGRLFPGGRFDLGDVVGGVSSPDPQTPDPRPDQPAQTAVELLERAESVFEEADAALAARDLGLYQEKVAEAEALVARALAQLAAGN